MAGKKTKFEEFISDMKSITQIPMFTLSPAKRIEREEGDAKKDEKVKTKILEAWNNIRYGLLSRRPPTNSVLIRARLISARLYAGYWIFKLVQLELEQLAFHDSQLELEVTSV